MLKKSPASKTCTHLLATASIDNKNSFYVYASCEDGTQTISQGKKGYKDNSLYGITEDKLVKFQTTVNGMLKLP